MWSCFLIAVWPDYYHRFLGGPPGFPSHIRLWQYISIQSSCFSVSMWSKFWACLAWIWNLREPGTRFSIWHITPIFRPMMIKVVSIVECIQQQLQCQLGWSLLRLKAAVEVFDAIYEWGCCRHPAVLQLHRQCIACNVHIVSTEVHFNLHAISHSIFWQ